MGKKAIWGSALTVAVVVGSLALASPASAKNHCGPLSFDADGFASASGRVVQSCDAGTQAVYTVHCLVGTVQFSKYYPQAFTAITRVSCYDRGSIRYVDVNYR